jgi:phage-related tail fiber protein
MAQYNIGTIDPGIFTGNDLATALPLLEAALNSNHRGATRPAYAVAGLMWAQAVSGTVVNLFYFDGSVDHLMFRINPSTGAVTDAAAFLRNAANLNAGKVHPDRLTIATLAQAQAGTLGTVLMSPESTTQAIDALRPLAALATAAQGLRADSALQPGGDGSGLTGIAGTPTGAVLWFAASAAPAGFLKANGAAVSRATYSNLFAVIGVAFGVGNGSTTFNVPELRGEFIRGWDDARGVDGSRVFGSAQTDEFEAHTHNYTRSNITRTDSASAGSDENEPVSQSTVVTSSAGGASETRPRNIALLACISF